MTTRTLIALLCIAGLLSLSAHVSAATTQTWTTTAHFDAGDKADPGTEYFASNGVDQPTYAVSKPTSIYVNVPFQHIERTYAVYQGGGGFTPWITYYDHRTGRWAEPVEVNASNPVQGDGHGAPAMWVDPQGYIFVAFGAHATPFQMRRSSVPFSISSWVSLPTPTPLPVPQNQGSYPHFFQVGSKIYLAYRQGTAGGDGVWGFRTTTNRGQTWSAFTTILDFRTDGAYISDMIHIASQGKVYYTFVWDERVAILRHNAYVCVWDLATNTQYGINGVSLGAVVSLAEADANCRAVYSGTVGQLWYSTIALDSSFRPYMLYVNGTGIDYNTYNISWTYWTGSAWTAPVHLDVTDGTSSYLALRVISPTNITGYITTGGFRQLADPADDYSGDVEQWHWDGLSWTFQITVMSEARAGNPVNRPVIPLNAKAPISMLFDSWNPKDSLVPESKLWAWDDSTLTLVPKAQDPSGTWGVETITDNLRIAADETAIANGLSDTFATDDADAQTYKWSQVRTGDGAGNFTRSFVGGAYNISAEDTGTSGRLGATLRSNYGLEGNIDLRAKFTWTVNESTSPAGNVFVALCLFDTPDECDTVSGDYFYSTQGVYMVYGHNIPALDSVKRVNQTLTGIGSTSAPVCSPCWLRITRAAQTFTFYYSTDGIAWTQDEQETIPGLTAARWYVHVSVFSNGVNTGDWSVEVDDEQTTTGTVKEWGRKVGEWFSPDTQYAGEIVRNVTVTYAGASLDTYIDSMAIVDSVTHEELYVNDSDIKTGSSVFYELGDSYGVETGLIGHDFRVRLTLIGGAPSTLVVRSVTVSTARSSALVSLDRAIDLFWLIVFASILIALVVGAWWVGKWRGV